MDSVCPGGIDLGREVTRRGRGPGGVAGSGGGAWAAVRCGVKAAAAAGQRWTPRCSWPGGGDDEPVAYASTFYPGRRIGQRSQADHALGIRASLHLLDITFGLQPWCARTCAHQPGRVLNGDATPVTFQASPSRWRRKKAAGGGRGQLGYDHRHAASGEDGLAVIARWH